MTNKDPRREKKDKGRGIPEEDPIPEDLHGAAKSHGARRSTGDKEATAAA